MTKRQLLRRSRGRKQKVTSRTLLQNSHHSGVQGTTSSGGGITFQPNNNTLRNADELEVIKAIIAREKCLTELQESVCALSVAALKEKLTEIRIQTVVVVETISAWRKRFVRPYPFNWEGLNYILRIPTDLDFVKFARPLNSELGYTLTRNPFALPKKSVKGGGGW